MEAAIAAQEKGNQRAAEALARSTQLQAQSQMVRQGQHVMTQVSNRDYLVASNFRNWPC